MSLASEWATKSRDLENARPKFVRQRFQPSGSFPYSAVLAQVADDGALQVLGPIRPEEVLDFTKWLRETWAP